MTRYEAASPAAIRGRSASSSAVFPTPALGMTVYGCEQDEAALFDEMAPRLGVLPRVTAAAVCESNVGLACGNRCVSVGHKTPVTNATLLALSQAGVKCVSTRSVGHNHIDISYAAGVGISVETVAYSPDSVADYTLMLMLMVVRHAKTVIKRSEVHDYRSCDLRGRELRDLTIGVIGTGRIGGAVLGRLQGFGCRTLAYDVRPKSVCRLRLTRRSARAERRRDPAHAAHRGDPPSSEPPPDRADEAWRGDRQHRPRRADRHGCAGLSVGERPVERRGTGRRRR